MSRKILAVGIILLFVGVTIAPTINFNTVKASQDDDLVEVTTQACGINGFGNTTVKLTREQYQNLEQYLVDFNARYNKTTKRAETIPLFNEAIVELNKYGMLPKGLNIEQAQKLVAGQYQDKKIMRLQDKLIQYHLLTLDNTSNYDCSIVGQGTWVYFFNHFGIDIILYLQKNTRFSGEILFWIVRQQPLKNNSYIELGETSHSFGNELLFPYEGYINTVGLNGNQSWNGPLYGKITSFSFSFGGESEGHYIGVKNFNGITMSNNGSTYFFGAASYVKIQLGMFPH